MQDSRAATLGLALMAAAMMPAMIERIEGDMSGNYRKWACPEALDCRGLVAQ